MDWHRSLWTWFFPLQIPAQCLRNPAMAFMILQIQRSIPCTLHISGTIGVLRYISISKNTKSYCKSKHRNPQQNCPELFHLILLIISPSDFHRANDCLRRLGIELYVYCLVCRHGIIVPAGSNFLMSINGIYSNYQSRIRQRLYIIGKI